MSATVHSRGIQMLTKIMAVVAAASIASIAQAQSEGSRAYTFSENDNQLIVKQQAGGDPGRPGTVKIEFYGHMAFKITSPEGVTVLIDPWRNDPSGAWGKWYPKEFPEVPVDVVMSTHAHFDHDATHRPHALMELDRLVGEFQLADLKVVGWADKHQCHSEGELQWDHITTEFGFSTCPPNNPLSFDNTIQIFTTGGLRIADWGDNRPVPSPEIEAQLMNVDILILPIDGTEHILTNAEVDSIIHKYRPRAVIPAHYLVVGAESVLSGLRSADDWVKTQQDVSMLERAELDLSKSDLTGAQGRVYYFGNHYLTK